MSTLRFVRVQQKNKQKRQTHDFIVCRITHKAREAISLRNKLRRKLLVRSYLRYKFNLNEDKTNQSRAILSEQNNAPSICKHKLRQNVRAVVQRGHEGPHRKDQPLLKLDRKDRTRSNRLQPAQDCCHWSSECGKNQRP